MPQRLSLSLSQRMQRGNTGRSPVEMGAGRHENRMPRIETGVDQLTEERRAYENSQPQ